MSKIQCKNLIIPRKDVSSDYGMVQQSSTPLLDRLPLELRYQIWGHVLGNRTIHIKFAPNALDPSLSHELRRPGRFHYILCEAGTGNLSLSNRPSNQGAHSQDTAGQPGTAAQRHRPCYSQYPELQLDLSSAHYRQAFPERYFYRQIMRDFHLTDNRLDLGLLRVSRQVHAEAKSILWATSTWSFTHALAFYAFVSGRDASQKDSMRRLHLDLSPQNCWIRGRWAVEWEVALREACLEEFTGLRMLHIDIAQLEEWNSRLVDGEERAAMPELKELKRLPLTHVQVTCVDGDGILLGKENGAVPNGIREVLLGLGTSK